MEDLKEASDILTEEATKEWPGSNPMIPSIVAAQEVLRREEEKKKPVEKPKGIFFGKGNPMTPEEIEQVANKVATKVLEEVSPAILDPAGRV